MNKKYTLNYLKNGLSVFPTKGKKPLVKWEPFQKEHPTEDQVNEWWDKWPDADIACATGAVSNLIVVDVDGGEVPQLPPTAVSETSPGHYQYFFKHPGFPVQNSAKVVALNIDIRGDGGFCVLPPSNHFDKDGKEDFTYTWLIPPKEGGFAELPKWILEKVKVKKPLSEIVNGAPKGERNTDTASLVGSLLTKYPQKDWESICWPLVKSWNTTNNTPPLEEKELFSVFQSISKTQAQNTLSKHLDTTYPPSEINRVFEPILAKNVKTLPMIDINWVWSGLLALDNLTLLASREKLGKTTFMEGLFKALADGGEFLGFEVVKSKTIIISEEPMGIWNRRLTNLGLDESENLWIVSRPFKTRLKLKDWEAWLLEKVAPFCEEKGATVLILDTISPIWPVLDENDAVQTQTALLPLTAIAEKGTAVLAVHHYSKAGDIRGSTVIGAVPSILLNFGKPKGDEETTKRELKVRSRFEESPDNLLLDYKNHEYILLGTNQSVQKQERLSKVKEILTGFENGATAREILNSWDNDRPSLSMLKIYLDNLIFTQSVYVAGTKEIKGGKALIYSLYPNNSDNWQGKQKNLDFEANNPNNFGRGAIYPQGSEAQKINTEEAPPF